MEINVSDDRLEKSWARIETKIDNTSGIMGVCYKTG